MEPFNPRGILTSVALFFDSNALQNKNARQSKLLLRVLGATIIWGDLRPPKTSHLITVKGLGPSKEVWGGGHLGLQTHLASEKPLHKTEKSRAWPRKQARATVEGWQWEHYWYPKRRPSFTHAVKNKASVVDERCLCHWHGLRLPKRAVHLQFFLRVNHCEHGLFLDRLLVTCNLFVFLKICYVSCSLICKQCYEAYGVIRNCHIWSSKLDTWLWLKIVYEIMWGCKRLFVFLFYILLCYLVVFHSDLRHQWLLTVVVVMMPFL